MKTEFLKELGLEQEKIDKVMAENGKDVEAEKAKVTAKDGELTKANQTIKDLQDTVKKFDGVDVKALNQQITDLQSKYDADISQTKLDSALEVALMQGKAKNTKAVKALLDASVIKLDGDKLLGLDDQLANLKKESGYLFDEAPAQDGKPPASSVKLNSGGEHKDNSKGEATTLNAALKDYYKVQ